MNDDLVRLDAALDALEATVAGVRTEQLHDPTPCASWDVERLLQHLVGQVLTQFNVVAEGGSPDWGAPPSPFDDGWAEQARARSITLRRAWAAAPEERRSRLPMQLAELVTHTWDLASATGQSVSFSDAAAERGLEWARGMLKTEYRGDEAEGKAFGPEVTVAADAPAHQRLVAWFGRDPQWASRPA